MSISLWAYNPNVCDGDYCCGECDKCSKYDEAIEDEETEVDE